MRRSPPPPRSPRTSAPAELLPAAGAVAHWAWTGTETAGPAFAQTAAYASLVDSGLLPAIQQSLTEVIAAAEADAAENGMPQSVSGLKALGEAVVAGGASVSVNLLEGPPLPSVFLVLHGAADEGEALLASLSDDERGVFDLRVVTVDGVAVTAGNFPDVPPMYNFGLWRVGEHLVIAAGPGAVQAGVAVTKADAAAVTTLPLAQQTPADALIAGWVDFATIIDRFADAPAYDAEWRPSGQVTVGELIAATGLDALGGLRGSLSADGRALRSEGEWTLRGEARGLLTLLNPEPISLADLPPMPAAVGSFAAASVDLGAAYDGLVDAAKALAELQPPDSPQRKALEDPTAVLNALAEFDTRGDLLAPLGNVTAVYSDVNDGGLLGGVGAVSVDDGPRFRAGLDTLIERGLALLPPDAEEHVSVLRTQRRGRDLLTISIGGFFQPTIAVTDDWLIVAFSPQAVTAFFMREDGDLPRWTPDGDWAAPFARVPQQFTALSAADPRPMVAGLNALIGFGLPALNHYADGPVDVPLPPSEVVLAPLFPNVSWVTNTGRGVRGEGYASLPAPLSSGGAAAGVPVMVSLLLPAVQQARAAARRAQSQNNLKQQALAAHNYHAQYAKFPRGTIENADLPVDRRLSHFVAVLPFLDEAALWRDVDASQAWNAGPNDDVARTVIPSLVNPSVDGQTTADGYAVTHYVGIGGVGAKAPGSPVATKKTGMFGYDRAAAIREARDGTTNTLLYGSVNADVGPWARGGASTVRAFTQQPYINGPDGFGGNESGGTNFAFADGSVRSISEFIDPEVLEALATANGGEVVEDWEY